MKAAAVNTVTAVQGETISHIAYKYYGTSRGWVEKILQINPHLCELPAMLPMGTLVKLPAKPAVQPVKVLNAINLWD